MIIKTDQKDIISIVSQILLNNGVVILPSDTIYGFSCIPGEPEKRIESIKGRDTGKHFLKLTLPEYLPELTNCTPSPNLMAYWPGPLTLIVPGKKNPTEGIRVPDNQFLQNILKTIKKPLISTSVNYSGTPPLNNIDEIIRTFEDKVDLIVDGGTLSPSLPSTIVDITCISPKIVRQGQLVVEL